MGICIKMINLEIKKHSHKPFLSILRTDLEILFKWPADILYLKILYEAQVKPQP